MEHSDASDIIGRNAEAIGGRTAAEAIHNVRMKLRIVEPRFELDGVLDFHINYILNTVSVRYDSDKVTLAKIRKTIGTKVAPRSR